MKIKSNFILCLLLFVACSSPKQDLKVTYLGGCGFLYQDQLSKVLIDPFGTEYGSYFNIPASKTLTAIQNSETPFDGVDLVLITHIHGDHFNPFQAETFLQSHKQVKMICPPQVVEQMKDSCSGFEQVKEQLVSPLISMNHMKRLEINGISVAALRLQHGTDRSLEGVAPENYTEYELTQNFGYVIDLGNKVILHQGDGCLKINEQGLSQIDRKVDIAYLSFFDWDPASYHFLKDKCQADTVIFMHGTIPGDELKTEGYKSIASSVFVFKQELETHIFN